MDTVIRKLGNSDKKLEYARKLLKQSTRVCVDFYSIEKMGSWIRQPSKKVKDVEL